MSEVKVNKLSPRSGTTVTLGDSGDTFTVPSGVTLANSGTITGFTSTGIDDNATSTAITIDSSENVGIGTASPSNVLHIKNSNPTIRLEDSDGSSSIYGQIIGNAAGDVNLSADAGNAGSSTKMTFSTDGSERMRINSSGNVGIGTSSPDEKIHAESSVATKVKAKTTTSTTLGGFEAWGNSTSYIKMYQFGSSYGGTTFGGVTGNNQAVIEAQEVSSLAFTTQGGTPDIIFAPARTARMTIKNGGNVGIGTSSPAHNVEIVATSSGSVNDSLQIRNNATASGTGSRIRFINSTDSNSDTNGAAIASVRNVDDNDLVFEVENSEAMRIDHAGNVGIGETSPLGLTHIKSADSGISAIDSGADELIIENSGNAGITIASGSTSFGKVLFADSSNNADGQILYDQNGRSLRLGTAGSERVRIDNNSGDRVFIGTTSDVSHGMSENNRLIVSGYSGNGAGMIGFMDTSGNTDGTITVGDGSMTITADTQNTTASSSLRFRVDNDEKMRIDSNGSLFIGATSEPNGTSGGAGFVNDTNDRKLLVCAVTNTGTRELVEFRNPNGTVGKIETNGSSTNYVTSSDYRLKENVSYDFDATTRLKQLKPARFNFIADADTTVDGFLAHEVSDIVPKAITGTKDAVDEDGNPIYQGIDQSKLVPLLVKTIQELEARITTLEANNP